MSGWQCEPLNPKPPKPSTFEHVRFTRADVGAKWVGNNRKRFRSSQTTREVSSLTACRAVWDNLKRFRSSQTTREVSSLTTCRAVRDNLKRFRSSQTTPAVFSPHSALLRRRQRSADSSQPGPGLIAVLRQPRRTLHGMPRTD